MNRNKFYETIDISDDPNRKFRNERHEVSPLIPIVFTIFVCLSCFIVNKLDARTPDALSESEAGENAFSAIRAYKDLVRLTDLGPKVTGSDACVKAEELLLTKLENIRAVAKQEVLMDRQQSSGHYQLQFSTPFINSYADVINVVAMLVGRGGSESPSLLINCHYDSVPESPGASDDIISCAAMLEILSILSIRDTPLRHNIIFLFNGAEENPLQASHAFITQHMWSKNISAFINLEAAGMGGRECLFQAGPGRAYLIEAYAEAVPHPHAQVVAEELFQSGVIPSDTDFRIFRDFADIPGLDIAFAKYGQVYHTKYDKASLIPLGSLQRVGDNLLALSKILAESDHLNIKEPRDDSHNMVYFDYLGFFMVLVSGKNFLIANWFIVVFGVATVVPQVRKIINTTPGLKELFFCLISTAISCAVAFYTAYFILPMLANSGAELTGGWLMKWYSKNWLIIPMYCLPIATLYTVTSILFDTWRSYKSSISVIERAKIHLAIRQVAWSIFVAVFLIVGKGTRAAHVLTIPLFIISFSTLLLDTHSFWPDHWWFYAKLPFLVLNLFWALYYSLLMTGLILPILGRSGSAVDPEIVVAVLCLMYCTFATMGLAGMEILLSRSKSSISIIIGTGTAILVIAITIMLLPINPYNVGEQPSPQRYLIMHSSRKFHDGNTSSGYWIVNMDANSPDTVAEAIINSRMKESSAIPAINCKNYLACGYPVHTGRTYEVCRHSSWIEAPPPKLPTEAILTLLSKECDYNNTCLLKFKITGPTHMSLMVCGKRNVSVSTMGINATKDPSWMWNQRPVLLLYHTSGIPDHEWLLEIEAKIPIGQSLDEPFLEFALSGHSTFHNEFQTSEFKKFLSEFPNWTHVTSFLSSYESLLI